jgi:hypothetical protein
MSKPTIDEQHFAGLGLRIIKTQYPNMDLSKSYKATVEFHPSGRLDEMGDPVFDITMTTHELAGVEEVTPVTILKPRGKGKKK